MADELFDYYQEVARSAFSDMLFDEERNHKYSLAISSAIKYVQAQGKKANVLDIGTGSGLLAMLAAKHNADSVTTIEAFTPTSIVARKVIEANGYKNKIKMICKHSTEVRVGIGEDMEQKANILVAELLDTELIGEGALRTYNEAHQHLLEPDCISVPHSAQVYVQIVDSKLATSWFKLEDFSIDGDKKIQIPEDIKECKGLASILDIQLSQFPLSEFKNVSNPIQICEFNFATGNAITYDESFSHKFRALDHANSAIIFFWWTIHMNKSGSILLSCAPHWNHPDANKSSDEITRRKSIPWRDHWMQGAYYVPKRLVKDEEYVLTSNHDEFSWFFDINSEIQTIEHPICKCSFHMCCSRNRIMQINDDKKRFAYMEMMKKIDIKNVLFIGDHSLLSLIAPYISNAQSITIFQEDTLCFKSLKKIIDYNGLSDKVKVISDLSEISGNVTHVIADSYFKNAVLPLDNITEILKIINKLRSLKGNSFKVIPSKVVVHSAPVHFDQLYKIRWPLELSCEGFDHKCFDKVIEHASKFADENIEPFSLWEYPCYALGKSKNIFEVDFNENKFTEQYNATIEIDNFSMNCNGITFWTEWILEDQNSISTGPSEVELSSGELINWKFDRQAVHLIPYEDIAKGVFSSIKITFNYEKVEEEISAQFSYNYK